MSFKKKYPTLFNFFAGYFPDADFENMSDEEVVSSYKSDCSCIELSNTKAQLNNLINNPEDWEDAAYEANRHFISSINIFSWLDMINNELSK